MSCNLENLKRLARSEELEGDIVFDSLRSIVEGEKHKGRHCHVLSNYFMTDLSEERKNSIFNTLQNSNEFFSSEVILVPFHQKTRHHWSTIAIYPSKHLVVHCDSLPDKHTDQSAFSAMNKFIYKSLTFLGIDAKNDPAWNFMPLHRFGLPIQDDSYSCGIYCCIFGYCLLMMKDLAIVKSQFPLCRYWIGLAALNRSKVGEGFSCRASNIWEKTRYVKKAPSLVNDIPVNHNGPFATLQDYMQAIATTQETKTGFQYANEDEPSDSDYSDTGDASDRTTAKAFESFCDKHEIKVCNSINMLKSTLDIATNTDVYTSERFTALSLLRPSLFSNLQQNSEFPLLSNFSENNIYNLLRVAQRVLCQTIPNDDDDGFFVLARKPKYALLQMFNMTRCGVVERVIFPELLTLFMMDRYTETYESATGRIYGKDYPSHTFFWNCMHKL